MFALHCEIGRERISEIYAMPKTHATHGLATDSAGRVLGKHAILHPIGAQAQGRRTTIVRPACSGSQGFALCSIRR